MPSQQSSLQSGDRGLARTLTLTDAVAIGLGSIIGAGIFVVTGVAAGIAGPSLILSLLIAAVAAMCNALSSAELARIYPQSGGTYEYGYQKLSPWFGFSAGWMFLVSKLCTSGVAALGFAYYFTHFFPGASPIPIAASVVILLTGANCFGVKRAGILNKIIVSITIASLLYFTVAGSFTVRLEHFEPFFTSGISGVFEAAALLFFAFTGYARIATLGEEVAEPERTIPKAILITVSTAAILYVLVMIAAVGSVGTVALSQTTSPLEMAAQAFALPGVKLTTVIVGMTAMLGVLLGEILGTSRMMFAMAHRRDLPVRLTTVSKTHSAPVYGILLSGSIILIVTVAGTLPFVVSSASFTILLYYAIANLSALRLSPAERLYSPVIPVIGFCCCVGLACTLPLQSVLSGIGVLSIGVLYRAVRIAAVEKGS